MRKTAQVVLPDAALRPKVGPKQGAVMAEGLTSPPSRYPVHTVPPLAEAGSAPETTTLAPILGKKQGVSSKTRTTGAVGAGPLRPPGMEATGFYTSYDESMQIMRRK